MIILQIYKKNLLQIKKKGILPFFFEKMVILAY